MAEDIDQLSRQLSAKQAEVAASKAVLDQAMQKQAVVMQVNTCVNIIVLNTFSNSRHRLLQ